MTVPLATLSTGLAALLGIGCMKAKCDHGTGEPVPSIITVANASTGQAVCDAHVVATCGSDDASMTLVAYVPNATGGMSAADAADPCQYGVVESSPDGGTVTTHPLYEACLVQVSKAGFKTVVLSTLSFQPGSCDLVGAEIVSAQLEPL